MLDYSFFNEIGLSDNKKLVKFFSLYLDTVPRYLTHLEKAIEIGDIKTFREINHKLRPNLLYFQNQQVNEAMQLIQGNQTIDNIRAHFPQLKQSLTEVIHQVEQEKERLQNEQ